MKKYIITILISVLTVGVGCKTQKNKLKINLDFEQIGNNQPIGWVLGIGAGEKSDNPNYVTYLDSTIVQNGKYSAVIEHKEGTTSFQSWAFILPDNYDGQQITLSGYIKTENVTDGYAGLWMRIDPQIAFDNMNERGVIGTTDWTKYEISLQMNPNATKQIVIGGLLVGKGKMWLDNLTITIDGEDITNAKTLKKPAPKTSLSRKEKATLKKYIYPLRTFEPDGGDIKDLKILEKLIGDSKVVALGEVTHGSSEIFKMKNRIIQYLAINNGFDIFSIEANMPEAYKVSDYVVRGVGDPNKLITGMYFWTWRTEEVLNMVEWMHKFNQPNKRIEFTGFDMQFYDGSINELLEAFKGKDEIEKHINDLKKKLDEIRTRSRQNRGMISVEVSEQQDIDRLISIITNSIESSSFQVTQKAWLFQTIVVIQQYLEMNNYLWRDKCMADNFLWIKEQNPNSKLVIWAHNGHIQKTNQMMGNHLSQKLGNGYTTFGFAFFDGSYTAAGDKGLT
jgi:erythromycin esterase